MLNALAGVCALIGTALVGVGLYRRDPAAQRIVRRARGWIARKVLRRRPVVPGLVGSIEGTLSLTGEAMTPPLKPNPSAPLPERVARLEENIGILSRTIRSQADARCAGDRKLRGEIRALADSVSGRHDELRRLIDENSVPARTEWLGLGFFVLGGVLATAAALT